MDKKDWNRERGLKILKFIAVFIIITVSLIIIKKEAVWPFGSSTTNKDTLANYINSIKDKPIFYYYNLITNPFNGDNFFVLKDNFVDENKSFYCLTRFGDSEEIVLDECKQVGSYCGGNTDKGDSQLCLLAQLSKNGGWKPLANLFFPNSNKYCSNDPYCYRFDGKNGLVGAELLKFSAVDVVDIFYGENTDTSNSQQVRRYNIENDELSAPILYYDWASNQSYFAIGQPDGILLFLNDIKTSPALWGSQVKTPGVYFIDSSLKSSQKIKKLSLPGQYDYRDKPSIDFDIRTNYENGDTIEFVIKDYGTKYTFNFKTKKFEVLN